MAEVLPFGPSAIGQCPFERFGKVGVIMIEVVMVVGRDSERVESAAGLLDAMKADRPSHIVVVDVEVLDMARVG